MAAGSRRSAALVRCCLVAFAVISGLCVSGPALYSKINQAFAAPPSPSCPPCICDCPPPLSLEKIAPGILNLTVADCGKNDPELSKEMEKRIVDLLTEELKLQEAVAEEHSQHMNATLVEAKRVALQYQRETEKCNSATELCEEARERAVAALAKETKLTAIWQNRAKQLGWHEA